MQTNKNKVFTDDATNSWQSSGYTHVQTVKVFAEVSNYSRFSSQDHFTN